MPTSSEWGESLKGMGAWFAGKGPQYELVKQQEAEALREQDLQAGIRATVKARTLLSSPEFMSALPDLLGEAQQTMSPQAFERYAQDFQGDPQSIAAAINNNFNEAVSLGHISVPKREKPQIVDGQVIMPNGQGGFRAEQIQGFESPTENQPMTPYQSEQVRLRAAQLDFDKAKAEAAANKLSPQMEEYHLAQDAQYQEALGSAQSAMGIADSYSQYVQSAGIEARFEEYLKATFGTEDAVTQFRKEYTKIRNSLVMGDLPPGVASDKDIKLAMSGYPEPTANPDYVASFMRGMAKLNQYKAARALYNKNYISANRGIEKKDRYWKAPIEVKRGDQSYSTNLAEIYFSAMEAGITVEEMLKASGVSDPKILKVIGY